MTIFSLVIQKITIQSYIYNFNSLLFISYTVFTTTFLYPFLLYLIIRYKRKLLNQGFYYAST